MPPGADAARLRTRDAIALGLLHGPAELLPVSSSAHVTLVPWLLGWPYASLDADLRKRFEVALHAGTLAALLVGLRARGRRRAARARPRRRAPARAQHAAAGGRRARVRAADRAPARHAAARSRAASPRGALALAAADALGAAHAPPRGRDATSTRSCSALAQACALHPGVSRSGATLTVARARGFARADASVLSLHAALPVIAGAAGAEGRCGSCAAACRRAPRRGSRPGSAASFAGSLAAIRAVRAVDRDRSLLPFAAYRIALAALVRRRAARPREGAERRRWPKSIAASDVSPPRPAAQ